MFRRPDLVFERLEKREVPANTLTLTPIDDPNESAGTVVYVELARTNSDTVTVNYATSNGTATAGSDYTAASGMLTFGPEDETKTFAISITNDSLAEYDETFTVTLSSPSNAVLGSPSSDEVTIYDNDDDPEVSFGPGTSVSETAGTFNIVATLSAASGKTITVDYQIYEYVHDATPDEDFVADSDTLTFTPGQTTQNIAVTVLNDETTELDEQFVVEATDGENVYSIGYGFATLTIQDDEAAWTPSEGPIGTSEPEFSFGPSGQFDGMSGEMFTSLPFDTGGGGGGIELGGGSGGGGGGTSDDGCGCGGGIDIVGDGFDMPDDGGGIEIVGNPGGGINVEDFATELVYTTAAFDVKPIISGIVSSSGAAGVPDEIQVRLTWDGTAGSWITLTTGGRSAGDDYAVALQVPNAVTTTGYYAYQLEVVAIFSEGAATRSISGYYPVVIPANDNGRGWTVAGVDKIVPVTGGVLYVSGSGGARFFGDAGSGTYTSPAVDRGTLVKNGDNTYTYTSIDQNEWSFATDGKLSNIVDTHSLRTTFTYNGSDQIENITRPSGFVTTFTYNAGYLQTVIQPGGARFTLTQSSGDLTNVALPDGSLRRSRTCTTPAPARSLPPRSAPTTPGMSHRRPPACSPKTTPPRTLPAITWPWSPTPSTRSPPTHSTPPAGQRRS